MMLTIPKSRVNPPTMVTKVRKFWHRILQMVLRNEEGTYHDQSGKESDGYGKLGFHSFLYFIIN